MNGARATKNISLVLVSSLLVFAGWSCGDQFREEAEARGGAQQGHAGGQHVHVYGTTRYYWWHSGYYTGGGGGGGGGGSGKSAAPSSSVRGGFGTTGHSVGA